VPAHPQGKESVTISNTLCTPALTDGSTDTNQLNVTTLQLAVGVVVDLSHRSDGTGAAGASALKGLFFVDMRALDLILVEVATGGDHDGGGWTEVSQFRVWF
jgi:hypothetical protein